MREWVMKTRPSAYLVLPGPDLCIPDSYGVIGRKRYNRCVLEISEVNEPPELPRAPVTEVYSAPRKGRGICPDEQQFNA